MNFVMLNDQEIQQLIEGDYCLWPAYVLIKKHMNGKTGITGIERKISYQWLIEHLSKGKSQGKAARCVRKDQARYMITKMEKLGLVTRLSKPFESGIILKHNYVSAPNSVSEKFPRGFCEKSDKLPIAKNKKTPLKSMENVTTEKKCSPISEEVYTKLPIPLYHTTKTNKFINNNKYQTHNKAVSVSSNLPLVNGNLATDVQRIFDYWCQVHDHPDAKLDKKRYQVIAGILSQGYDVAQCQQAILGCRQSPFHMGDNPQRQRYDHLSLIFRDSEHVDRFIHFNQKTPIRRNKHHEHSSKSRSGLNGLADAFESEYQDFLDTSRVISPSAER